MEKLMQSMVLLVVGSSLIACGQHEPIGAKLVPAAVIPEVGNVTSTTIEELDEMAPAIALAEAELIADIVAENPSTIPLREKVLAGSSINPRALDQALAFYDANYEEFSNHKYLTIFDIGRHSGGRRLAIVNLETGTVSEIHVSHGKNSDLDHDGYANSFSNVNGSNKSSLGFMKTAERYNGKHGLSLRLDGLESRNSNVRSRAIVVHGASYVSPSLTKMGRSLGCPAVSNANASWVVKLLEKGSLFYIFHETQD